ncbi:hypothetical protein LINGRAHAP2_LOCUS18195 [Linum grandiflorum]
MYTRENSDSCCKTNSVCPVHSVLGELGSFAPKYQASKPEYDFLHSRKSRKSSMEDVILEPDWSSHVVEHPRDRASLLSDESSSSTAVRHALMDTSTSYPTERHRWKHENAFDGLDTMYGASSIDAGERHQKKWGNSDKRGQRYMSGRSPARPSLLDPDLGNDFDPLFKEERGHCRDWPYEEGNWYAADTNKDFNTVHHVSETNHPSFVSKPWNEDLCGGFPVREHHIDPRSCSMSKYSRSVKHSPPNSFISGSVPAPDPPRPGSKQLFDSPLRTCPDFKFDGRSPKCRKEEDFFHGEWSVPNLSAEESVSKVVGYNKPKRQRRNDENMEGVGDVSEFGENVKDGAAAALETSSSVNIPEKSNNNNIDEEVEVAGGAAQVRRPKNACQSDKNGEVGNEGFVERKRVTRMDKCCVVSSPQVMMLESYVVQLLCVQKTART